MKKIFITPEISYVELSYEEPIMLSGNSLANKNNVKYIKDINDWSGDGFGSIWDSHDWI